MTIHPLKKKLETFQKDFALQESKETELLAMRDRLVDSLNAATAQPGNKTLVKENPLNQISETVSKEVWTSITAIMNDWTKGGMMRELSDTYADRIIFLVFGKVNAGKSSFCNYLADLFGTSEAKRFYFEDGKIKYSDERLAEGITETTARIQGVELGEKLTLLDTPGLHSVTEENGDLTRRFVDSADCILWVSKSTSPGQVQELDDLKKELENKKPLQPIITGSDICEEDVDENDEIIRMLVNKSPETRKMQEDDVYTRTKQVLPEDIPVRTPVSLSVHAWKQSSQTQKDHDEAGLTNILDIMAQLVDEGAQYKTTKASQQVVNYLNASVLGILQTTVLPQVDKLTEESNKQQQKLHDSKRLIASRAVAAVCAETYDLVQRYKNSKDTSALAEAVNECINKHLNAIIEKELAEFSNAFKKIQSELSQAHMGSYKDKTIEYEVVVGSSRRAASGGLGGFLGGAVGFFVGGPVGAAIGATLGGGAGAAVGSAFVETDTRTKNIGTSIENVNSELTANIKKHLPSLVEDIVSDIEKECRRIADFAQILRKEIETFETEVKKLR